MHPPRCTKYIICKNKYYITYLTNVFYLLKNTNIKPNYHLLSYTLIFIIHLLSYYYTFYTIKIVIVCFKVQSKYL